ncbi:MAG: hypothetical protein QOJ23_3909 [Actinomycetota bacterium]|jgi:hypothetical protein|nr:hypothetical protein [Actinomycetota bacterium]MDQ1497846.1 hypothetical protein [Actinomycetota bacterium]
MIRLRQEAITSNGRIKRWCRPGGGVVLYQVRLALDGDSSEVSSMEQVVYRVAGPEGVIEVTATRPERNFAAALWAMLPAAITVVLSSPDGVVRVLEDRLTLDPPVDDGATYEDVDLRTSF